MSNKQSAARAKGASGLSPLVKQTPIFTTYSASYKPLFEVFMQSVRQCQLDEAQVKPLAYAFPDATPQTPTGYRTVHWYQAQRQKFAYFRDQLAKLAPGQIGIFTDVDVQFFPNLRALDELLETMRGREIDMFILAEHGGPVINPGFFLAANSPKSRAFIERVCATLGDYGRPLHPPQVLIAEGEPEQVFNRMMKTLPQDALRWAIIPPEYAVFAAEISQVRWPKVLVQHAVCASGTQAKLEQMGRVRHIWYNWKHAEATGFPSIDTSDPLSGAPRLQGGVWIAKSQGKLHARDDGGIETRNPSVIKLLSAVQEKYPDIPDFRPTYVCTQDTPHTRAPGMTILAFSIDKRSPRTQMGQEVVAVPDNVFDHWRNAGMPDYEETCAQIRAAGRKVPQKNLAGWIGNAQMHPSRMKLLELAKSHPAELEAINTGIWKQVPDLPRFEVGQGRYTSLPEQTETYAFFLDVEGNGWSGRLKLLLHSGRPLLLQDRPWEEFYFSQLKPFEHFVPVAADMGDLIKQVQWLQGHPEEGDKIARNAQAFAAQHLTRAAAIDAWAKVLRTLSV